MHEDHRLAVGVGAVGEEKVVPRLALAAHVWGVLGRCRRWFLPAHEEHGVSHGLLPQALLQTLVWLHRHSTGEDVALATLGVLPLVQGREAKVGDRVLVALRLGDDGRPHGLDLGLVDLELCERPVCVARNVRDREGLGVELRVGVG